MDTKISALNQRVAAAITGNEFVPVEDGGSTNWRIKLNDLATWMGDAVLPSYPLNELVFGDGTPGGTTDPSLYFDLSDHRLVAGDVNQIDTGLVLDLNPATGIFSVLDENTKGFYIDLLSGVNQEAQFDLSGSAGDANYLVQLYDSNYSSVYFNLQGSTTGTDFIAESSFYALNLFDDGTKGELSVSINDGITICIFDITPATGLLYTENTIEYLQVIPASGAYGIGDVSAANNNWCLDIQDNIEAVSLGSVTAGVYYAIDTSGHYFVGSQNTGWTSPTGAAARTDFDPTTIILADLALQVNALKQDLYSIGLLTN